MTAARRTTLDMWFTRASKGYSGRGAKPTGYERHRVGVRDGALRVTSAVAFRNFGEQRYEISADGRIGKSRYRNGAITVDLKRAVGDSGSEGSPSQEPAGEVLWRARVVDGDTRQALSLRADADAVPSVVGRFLPLVLPRETGELTTYTAIAEDGFPGWRPQVSSWFPVMAGNRSSPTQRRRIVGVGDVACPLRGRDTVQAFRYDHVADGDTVVATTWVGEDGTVLRYEQTGCVLIAADPDIALALDPAAGA